MGALSKIDWRIYSAVCWQYIAFFDHSIIKNTSSPPVCHENDFWKTKKKLTLKKLLIYDFLCVTVWRICFPYISTLILENSQNIAFPSQVKKISFGVHIFFLLLYTLTYYTFCAWWEIKIFSQFYLDIVLPPSCDLLYFEITAIYQIKN